MVAGWKKPAKIDEHRKGSMATEIYRKKKRCGTDGLVPLNLMVPKRIKAQLEQKAKEAGMGVNTIAAMLLDLKTLEEQMGRMIEKEFNTRYGHYTSFLENSAIYIEETKRYLEQVLENHSIMDITSLFTKPKGKIKN